MVLVKVASANCSAAWERVEKLSELTAQSSLFD
jgi:hypothetical protein